MHYRKRQKVIKLQCMMITLNTAAAAAAPTWALLVSTQCYENYAFDAEGRLDTDRPYWKAKGGDDYLVTCATLDADSTALEQLIVIDRVRDQIEIDNGGFQESIIGWRIVPADYDPAVDMGPSLTPEADASYIRWLRDRLVRIAV